MIRRRFLWLSAVLVALAPMLAPTAGQAHRSAHHAGLKDHCVVKKIPATGGRGQIMVCYVTP